MHLQLDVAASEASVLHDVDHMMLLQQITCSVADVVSTVTGLLSIWEYVAGA